MKFNYDNTKKGDIFVPKDDSVKDPKFHGKILLVASKGVIMESPWLTALRINNVEWSELNQCFKKPKSLNK